MVGGTANITCSYPIYSDHSLPLISINGNKIYESINELPQSRYNFTTVPNSDGTLCTLTLFYHNVTATDNSTSYRFLLFIGSSREIESDPVRLYVHKPEDPPNSQCRLYVPPVHLYMYTSSYVHVHQLTCMYTSSHVHVHQFTCACTPVNMCMYTYVN